MEKYLVINGGSSSLKFSLYELHDGKEIELVNGLVEKIGKEDSFYSFKTNQEKIERKAFIKNHTEAVEVMLKELLNNNFINSIDEIKGVGHRVLHAGEYYSDSVLINDEVLNNIKSLIPFGPLHLPGEINAIESMIEKLPNVPQVAVFDTTFHQSIDKNKYLYGIPYELYEKYGIRKYGFHGTSYKYITETMKNKLNKENINLIICHLGSGGSICAIKNGKSMDTTMGFTPNDGIIMCTRSGNIDYSMIPYINDKTGMTLNEIDNMLNKESGLKGLVGVTDFRDLDNLVDQNNDKAILAWEMARLSVCKYLSYYIDSLNFELNNESIDGIVFTAGIGENNPRFRNGILEFFKKRNIIINKEENNKIAKFLEKTSGLISSSDSSIPVYVEPTNEELMIIKDTIRISKEKVKKLVK